MAFNNEDYAIVIGIDNYPQLRPLGAAVSDAIKFAEWLIAPEGGGLPSGNVKQITSPEKQPTDPFNATPIQRHIDLILRDWNAALNERIGRRLYFYFSGHGVGRAFDDVAMLMADASTTWLRSNIGLRPYLNFFHDTGLFDELVFIVDCCRDPTLADVTMPPGFTLEPKLPRPRVEHFSVLAAAYGAKAFEKSATATEERRGLLTKALLEALREKPSVDAHGRVTSSTLKKYVRGRVKELAAQQQEDQTPDFNDPSGDSMIFGVASPPLNLNVRVAAPAGFRETVKLLGGDGLPELATHTFAADGEVWDFPVPRNSLYLIESPATGFSRVLDPRNIKDDPYVIQLQ